MRICVYCSSSAKLDPRFYEMAERFGKCLAERGHSLVYGGFNNGIMGTVASAVHESGGSVLGVVPEIFNDPNMTYKGCDEVIFTEDLRGRKLALESHSDAFAILPGGVGTMDELFETLALKSLGEFRKPMAVLNCLGCYDELRQFICKNTQQGFMREEVCRMLPFYDTAEALLDDLEAQLAE